MVTEDEVARIRRYVRYERQAALLYRRLAETVEPDEAAVLTRLAEGEDAHARYWERVLSHLGADGPDGDTGLGMRGRLALALGRRFGLVGAMPVLERHEGREIVEYTAEPHAPASMVEEERDHTEMVRSLVPSWRNEVAGTLRAGVFGISDGVVSNLALVIGVFGAGVGDSGVVTAGTAGLVAGAASMAVGEYVSVASQREVLLAGSEDGHDPHANPMQAAVASLLTFAFGAFIPLLPFLLLSGTSAAIVALVATGVLLYGVGAALSLLTMRSPIRSGLRQLGLGWGAAALTYAVGLMLGAGGVA
ncbi:MAG TPA: VIT1/CCC1 transporter family protein [Euzebya sp.]|nr:VIT1/CCC1 transporter family protein [Euzebya sp.]